MTIHFEPKANPSQDPMPQATMPENEMLFSQMAEQNADGILIVDQSGYIRYANKSAQTILGRSRSELAASLFGFPTASGEMTEIDIIQGNHHKIVEMRVADMRWQGEQVFLASLRDVTDRKQTEEELRLAEKFESISILAGGIAHDFNNLLYVIRGNIEMALEGVETNSLRYTSLSEALDAAETARQLTRRFIEIAKGAKPERKKQAVEPMLNQLFQRLADNADFDFKLDVRHALWPVEMDAPQIKKCLRNIIANAQEAMPEGGPIRIQALNLTINRDNRPGGLPIKDGRYVRITVKDQGAGINDRHLQKVYDPYFSTKQRGFVRGMGLGLTTAYSIIKNHDGFIHLTSFGEGTQAIVYLPAAESKANPNGMQNSC